VAGLNDCALTIKNCQPSDDVLLRVKSWGIIADNLSKAGWSWGCVSAVDSNGRTIWIADAHRDDGKRFVVHADEKLTEEFQLANSRLTARSSFSNGMIKSSRFGSRSAGICCARK
jgi:hypothetical protein